LGISECGSRTLSPGGLTYRLMTQKLDGFTRVDKITEGLYAFTFKNGHNVFVLWGKKSTSMNLNNCCLQGQVIITHIIEKEDQEKPLIEKAPANAVPVNESPVFIEHAL
jgi:hypothetical protein